MRANPHAPISPTVHAAAIALIRERGRGYVARLAGISPASLDRACGLCAVSPLVRRALETAVRTASAGDNNHSAPPSAA